MNKVFLHSYKTPLDSQISIWKFRHCDVVICVRRARILDRTASCVSKRGVTLAGSTEGKQNKYASTSRERGVYDEGRRTVPEVNRCGVLRIPTACGFVRAASQHGVGCHGHRCHWQSITRGGLEDRKLPQLAFGLCVVRPNAKYHQPWSKLQTFWTFTMAHTLDFFQLFQARHSPHLHLLHPEGFYGVLELSACRYSALFGGTAVEVSLESLDVSVLLAQDGHLVFEQNGIQSHLRMHQRHPAKPAGECVHAGLPLGEVVGIRPAWRSWGLRRTGRVG